MVFMFQRYTIMKVSRVANTTVPIEKYPQMAYVKQDHAVIGFPDSIIVMPYAKARPYATLNTV